MYRLYSRRLTLIVCCLAIVSMIGFGRSNAEATVPKRPIDKIEHVIVIFQENWSFDGLYGSFPGANGIANAGDTIKQVDMNDKPYQSLPSAINNNIYPPEVDLRIPGQLPVRPYDLEQYVPVDQGAGDPLHRFYQNIYQINGGKMDKFVAWGQTGSLPMSFYDATNLPVGKLAQEYTLADNSFQAAFGGSLLNHFWLICGCTPRWEHAPTGQVAQLDDHGMLIKDGVVSPDGYVINNQFSVNTPRPPGRDDLEQLVPNLTERTVGDQLSDQNVSWAWYMGGWNDAVSGKLGDNSPYTIFSPFSYFARYADGTEAKAKHLKDETDFVAALRNGTLPAVSFVKPSDSEHPGESLLEGHEHVAELVRLVQKSPYWKNTAIFITYDENGGRWDHVAPPVIDRWGPGVRVPMIVISPYAKRGYVDHTLYDTTSILKFIQTRWSLPPLSSRTAFVGDLTNAFNFEPVGQATNKTLFLPVVIR